MKYENIRSILFSIIVLLSGFLSDVAQAGNCISEVPWKQDSDECRLYQVKDENGIPLYYYSDINQYPCSTQECYRMEVRIYWDMWGNFMKLAFDGEKELTKLNHQPFDESDYERLHTMLNNPNSGIKYYQLDDLTPKESEQHYYSVDAVSGATVVDVSYESVRGAVKTCYTLWNIIHGDVIALIRQESARILEQKFKTEKVLGTDIHAHEVVYKVIKGESASVEYIESVVTPQMVQSPFYLSTVLELARISEIESMELKKTLATYFKETPVVCELLVYNYLMGVGYKNKELRQYQVTQKYF